MARKVSGLEVAITGIAGRFPGARDLDVFWHNLKTGKESVRSFSDEELVESGIDPSVFGANDYVRAKGVLEGADAFDAGYFGYHDHEAALMDPQVRLLHEVSEEALADAGYNPDSDKESIGFYGGAFYNHYWEQASACLLDESTEKFDAVHLIDKDFLSSRISHRLNLTGPSISVSAACATSLVSVHLACRGLLTGDCTAAVVGAATVYLPQKAGYSLRQNGLFSRDGHCRPFEERASGFVGGEGVGAVVLKLLKRAIADGDHIHAVILGSAVDNDGRARASYSTPSVPGAVRAIRGALKFAGVGAESLGYLESHGTGTAIGDEMEFEALKQAFAATKTQYCRIGSHKANIGYLGPASGMAGLLKAVLCLKHKQIPPLINFERVNPNIDLESSPFIVNTQLQAWESDGERRRAGVNNISVGGTNVHLILEEWPTEALVGEETERFCPVLLSARTESALEALSKRLIGHLEEAHSALADVAYTLQTGRRAFTWRRAVVARSNIEVANALATLEPAVVVSGRVQPTSSPLYFVCGSSQNADHLALLDEMYTLNIELQRAIDRCRECVVDLGGGDLVGQKGHERATAGGPLMSSIVAEFACMYAVANYAVYLGIRPDGYVGYGVGDFVAGCMAGALSLEDALRATLIRGQVLETWNNVRALKVLAGIESVLPYANQRVRLGCELDEGRCILIGEATDLEEAGRRMSSEGIRVTPTVEHSSWGGLLAAEETEQRATDALRRLTVLPPTRPWMCSSTGVWLTENDPPLEGHLARSVWNISRVRPAVDRLLAEPTAVFVMVGTGVTVGQLIVQHPSACDELAIVRLMRGPRDKRTGEFRLLEALGRLWVRGVDVRWTKHSTETTRQRVSLPPYPFEQSIFPIPVLQGES